MLIICLGISSYLGISFAKTSMEETGNDYFQKQKFHDIQIDYNYGIEEEDLHKIRDVDGVSAVEGLYQTTGFLKLKDVNRLVTVQSTTYKIDIANVVDGSLPKGNNEIAIEKVMANEDKISIGDELEIDCSSSDGKNVLVGTKFKVVGIVEHPAYSCNYVYGRRGISEKGNGNSLNFFLVSENAFNKNQIGNCYQSAIVWSEELAKFNGFDDKYKNECEKLEKKISLISKERSKLRYEKVSNNMQGKASKLPELQWNVLNRQSNVSYAMYRDNAEGLGKLSFSFAFVYIIVAIMVCYSSIGRMITKQKLLIGTQKALGYSSLEINMLYIAYSWTCTFWGCIFGVLWAVFFVEQISLKSYKPIYYFQNYIRVCEIKLTTIVILSTFVLTLISTLIACRRIISKPAVSLLKEDVVKNGKKMFFEKSKLWKKISLFKRTVFKNLINEKRHMITTIIGVGGCTALMIIGFTLKFAMSEVRDIQFNYIQKFDVSLQVEKDSNIKTFTNQLEQFKKSDYINLMDRMIGVRINDKNDIVADLLCFDSDNMNDYFALEDEATEKKVNAPKEGVLISSNTAKFYNIKVNDKIEIMKDNGEKALVPVAGIVKNYVCHFLVMSPDYYKNTMGDRVRNNTFFIKLNGEDKDKIVDSLKDKKGYIAISGKDMGISIFNNIVDSLNSVVQIMIVLSAIMSLVVVLNLIVMYINEKSKALAVMRINGYTLGEVKAFITYSEIILNFFGLLVGTFLGVILGSQILQIIENDSVTYNTSPNIMACLISCGISIVYSMIVGYIAKRRINKLELQNLNRFD